MQGENEVAVQEKSASVDYAMALNSSSSFEQGMKMANFLSKSSFIPKDFKGNPSDCLVALQIAATLGLSPFEVMKGVYVIHGKPSFEAKFAIALVNRKGVFKEGISFESKGEGDSLVVTAKATTHSGKLISESFSLKQAKEAGWYARNPLYRSIPKQMLSYKAATYLIRLNCPEVLMGIDVREDQLDVKKKETVANKAVEEMNREVRGD